MTHSLSAPVRAARSCRALAVAALAVALVLPVGASSGAAAPAAAPVVRQLAFWAAGSESGLSSLTAQLRSAGARVVARLSVADAVVVEVPSTWVPPVGVVTAADRPMNVAGNADSSTQRAERSGTGSQPGSAASFDGDGVTVAIVDTGVADVPDLRGSVQHVNVSGAARGDGYGHGTFLAGLIASSGASSDGLYRGVAPKADILDVQVAEADGSTSLFRVLAGLQAVAERARHDDSLRVVNVSLSADAPGASGIDPLSRALEGLWDRGLVVVVAAGNDGPNAATVSVPGTDPAVITVGALDTLNTPERTDDVVAPFSARGIAGDPNAKPDLVAPGVSTVGLRAPGSLIDTDHPTARVGSANFRGSGTSMATAITSGEVAGLLSVLPDLDPDDVKAALTQGAYDIPGDSTATGAGGLDLVGATAAAQQLSLDHAPWAGRDVSAAYGRFAAAWQIGSRSAAVTAWLQLPATLRARIAQAWASSVADDGLADEDQAATAHRWASDSDLGAVWLSRSWASRSWASVDWASRSWASRSWASRSWASRSWASRSWASRSWADDVWASRSWASRSWASRSWASRSWASRSWAVDAWGTAAS
jgi:serine protease AprX